jgi:hypothetical protein
MITTSIYSIIRDSKFDIFKSEYDWTNYLVHREKIYLTYQDDLVMLVQKNLKKKNQLYLYIEGITLIYKVIVTINHLSNLIVPILLKYHLARHTYNDDA